MESEYNQWKLYGEMSLCMLEILETSVDFVAPDMMTRFMYTHLDTVTKDPTFLNPPDCEDFQWLNTTRPLNFNRDLQNKIYIIDFFTYCCINCIHILPILKAVEDEFKDDTEFAVIGIHSPKFSNEKNFNALQNAVKQYNITHPVLNDYNCTLWNRYGISCWPTVFIVGPSHKLLFSLVGETQISKLLFLSKHVKEYYQSNGDELDGRLIPMSLVEKPTTEGICYPGNISTNGELLLVSDTGNNCLVLMTKQLTVEERIGSGVAGYEDGPFNKASFNCPHGTCWYGSSVYVADTGNHAIRKVDFIKRIVSTVFMEKKSGEGIKFELPSISIDDNPLVPEVNPRPFLSPWDCCIGPELGSDLKKLNVLYIAVAGAHQIWSVNLESENMECMLFAGTGKEENRKNVYRFRAAFAQPTGITYSVASPSFLFIADSESSTIRSISLTNGGVNTICGGSFNPLDLFAYGDEDGVGVQARFQHPMSLCVINEDFLVVADTYNHAIKLVDIKRRCSNKICHDLNLCEPSGICLFENLLFIADTNNHQIKSFSLDSHLVSNLIYTPLQEIQSINSVSETVEVEIKYGAKISCFFKMDISDDCSLFTPEVPWEIVFDGKGMFNVKCNSSKLFEYIPPGAIELTAEPFSLMEGYESPKACKVTFILYVDSCNATAGTCSSRQFKHSINFTFKKFGARFVYLHLLNKL